MSVHRQWAGISHTELEGALRPWMRTQRWFRGTECAARISTHVILDAGDTALVVLYLMEDAHLYAVPLVFAPSPAPTETADPIAEFAGLTVYDATEHSAGQAALLAATVGTTPVTDPALASHPTTRVTTMGTVAQRKKVTSEQSNTSIIYRFAKANESGDAGIILKLFRVLQPGSNPDVELQQALDEQALATGHSTVPHQFGHLAGKWNGRNYDLTVAQEFLEGAKDAWQVMTEGLESTDGSLTDAAGIRALGEMTRKFHDDLAARFAVVPATAQQRTELLTTWQERADKALSDAPELEPYREKINEIFAAALSEEWPDLQRIHGDYHLGQVLDSPVRGWRALDFEGEPLRSLTQREHPDLALRDIAGMLRSFGYAAGSALLRGGDEKALNTWSKNAQETFMDGYGGVKGNDALLNALVLDKALYEVSYETASRPDWVQIPLAGVQQILLSTNENGK